MSKIAYDPTKDKFARWVRRSRFLRTLFYKTLDMLFLRSWYVRTAMRDMFKNYFSETVNVKILDAGCGFGQYDRFILKAFPGSFIHAIDIKEEYLDDCRFYFQNDIKNERISFDNHDLTQEELINEKYDLAVCIDVLEHIEDDIGVMKRIQKALRPGGFFLMHSPSHFSEADAEGDEFFVDEHARAGYSKSDLEEKMRISGLEPIALEYSYGKWGHGAWVMLIKFPMLWFSWFGMWTMLWLPVYYLITLLPALTMMMIDCKQDNRWGTGILGIAKKAL